MLNFAGELDAAVGTLIVSWLEAPLAQCLLLLFTVVGSSGAIWLGTAALSMLVFPARRMALWRTVLAIGLAGLFVDGVLKPVAVRARPFAGRPADALSAWRPTTSSFPSGHAATSGAGALGLSRAIPRGAPVFWLLAAAIALSRVALGMHYPSDVIAGVIVGVFAALVATTTRLCYDHRSD